MGKMICEALPLFFDVSTATRPTPTHPQNEAPSYNMIGLIFTAFPHTSRKTCNPEEK